jgi:hypothetical protein
MLKINQLMLLPKEDSGIHNLLIRVHGCHIKSIFQRRQPVVIVNPANNAKCIRYVMGGGSLSGLTKGSAALDYDAMDTLGFKMNSVQPCELIIRKTKPFESYLFFMNHPCLSTQLSIKLGLLGAVLGFLGLCLGVISLIA